MTQAYLIVGHDGVRPCVKTIIDPNLTRGCDRVDLMYDLNFLINYLIFSNIRYCLRNLASPVLQLSSN